MKLSKFLSITFLLLCFSFFSKDVNAHSFHPIVHAHEELYSFKRIPSHEIREDIKSVFKSFLNIKIKNVLKNIPELKHQLSLDGINKPEYLDIVKEQIDSLKRQAENKRKIANKIKESYDKAMLEASMSNSEYSENSSEIFKQNLKQIEYLKNKSNQLEKKAEHLEEYIKKIFKHKKSKKNKCLIKKIGILKYITSSTGLKHSIENVQVQIEKDGLNLYYKNELKKKYLWNLIEMPIKVIGTISQCFFFTYQNKNEIFCANNKIETNSWINAISEAFFCNNFEIQGTLINKNLDYENIKRRYKTKNEDLLIVDIKPEDNETKVYINDIEQDIENSNQIDINKLKSDFEKERNTKSVEETL